VGTIRSINNSASLDQVIIQIIYTFFIQTCGIYMAINLYNNSGQFHQTNLSWESIIDNRSEGSCTFIRPNDAPTGPVIPVQGYTEASFRVLTTSSCIYRVLPCLGYG
jgi:ABC-type multidrug transport system permease subunit